jgi:tRNA A37 threonylcarbamoyladenosine modification protein TsaB
MDAQRHEVFAALYAPKDGENGIGRADLVVAPRSAAPESVLDEWGGHLAGHPVCFIGDGATTYRREIESRPGMSAHVVAAPPLAGVIGRLAFARRGEAVRPHAIRPIYVRRPDAELARARRLGDGGVEGAAKGG